MVISSAEERLLVTSASVGTVDRVAFAASAACPNWSRLSPNTRIWTG